MGGRASRFALVFGAGGQRGDHWMRVLVVPRCYSERASVRAASLPRRRSRRPALRNVRPPRRPRHENGLAAGRAGH